MQKEEKDSLFKSIEDKVIKVMNNEPSLFGRIKKEVNIDKLRSKDRHKEIVVSRQMCFYLSNFIFNTVLKERISLAEMGNRFGQDHANVMHGIGTINGYLETESQITHMVALCIDELLEKANKIKDVNRNNVLITIVSWNPILKQVRPALNTDILVALRDGDVKCVTFRKNDVFYDKDLGTDISDYVTHWGYKPKHPHNN